MVIISVRISSVKSVQLHSAHMYASQPKLKNKKPAIQHPGPGLFPNQVDTDDEHPLPNDFTIP